MNSFITSVFQLSSILLILTGCGGIKLGSGSSTEPNDTRPSGNPIVQAQLTSQNGKTVSGAALIFASVDSSSGVTGYTLRLEGISVPAASALIIKVNASPAGQVASIQLRSNTGSQNYSLGSVQYGSTFSSVYIYSSTENINYAAALFTNTK
jgi:hypothetical protein